LVVVEVRVVLWVCGWVLVVLLWLWLLMVGSGFVDLPHMAQRLSITAGCVQGSIFPHTVTVTSSLS